MATLQSYNRGIRDLKMARWLGVASYDTTYDLLGARAANLSWVVETDELRGDDVVLDRYTKMISVTVSIELASVDLIVADMMTGGTLVSNAAYYDLFIADTDEVPYVAIAGRIAGSGGIGDLQFFVPKAKLATNLELAAQVDTYMLPQAEFQGVNEGAANGMLRLRHFYTTTVLEIPLRTAVGG